MSAYTLDPRKGVARGERSVPDKISGIILYQCDTNALL